MPYDWEHLQLEVRQRLTTKLSKFLIFLKSICETQFLNFFKYSGSDGKSKLVFVTPDPDKPDGLDCCLLECQDYSGRIWVLKMGEDQLAKMARTLTSEIRTLGHEKRNMEICLVARAKPLACYECSVTFADNVFPEDDSFVAKEGTW
ncbi:unnamed protein product [Lepeophtheirus salmonis]|uniref:(salmon louse) hypothetical protein n=1 Tax=Lepeophtheirus salmonis TaxID=72036 RepID=A0A7R8HAP3_LEPSM|nr:unnamed protein product [Lepeophtheirus salmonis]CAF2974195.1 unnamed protein product [Lepeophtheirus salmonis]